MNAPQDLPASLLRPGVLQRGARQTLSEQLCASIAQRIRSGDLAAGARLPSVRDCAKAQRLSPSTVVAAYDQLQAQGLVQARLHRGYFVRDVASHAPNHAATSEPVTPLAPALAAPVDATALIRGMFQGAKGQSVQLPGQLYSCRNAIRLYFFRAASQYTRRFAGMRREHASGFACA